MAWLSSPSQRGYAPAAKTRLPMMAIRRHSVKRDVEGGRSPAPLPRGSVNGVRDLGVADQQCPPVGEDRPPVEALPLDLDGVPTWGDTREDEVEGMRPSPRAIGVLVGGPVELRLAG